MIRRKSNEVQLVPGAFEIEFGPAGYDTMLRFCLFFAKGSLLSVDTTEHATEHVTASQLLRY